MKVLVLTFFLLIAGNAFAQYTFEAIHDSLVVQLFHFPQEKIHLHTDRAMYVPGEKIWFKAYLVDANSHQLLTHSLYVYVELIDSTHTIKKRVMIRRDENEMYWGHLLIPEKIPGGVYTVRAYTRFLENLGEDYFFKKNVRIGEVLENEEIEENRGNNYTWGSKGGFGYWGSIESVSRGALVKDNFHVSLLPEGGNLLAGVFCKVAFKAQNVNGYSEYITGEVVDEKGVQISPIKTVYAGMGSFVFVPEKNKRYYLKCKNLKGLERRFELPAVSGTYGIFTVSRNNNHLITVEKSVDVPEKRLFLLVQSRGTPFYFDVWDNKKKSIAIPSDGLPSGVIQFLLFDENMNALSERLVFNKSNDRAVAIFRTDKQVYGRREKVQAELSIKNTKGAILEGDLSISITDDNDTRIDSMTTILSNLLLSSELKGFIEQPAYYLQDNPESERALDLLMMTHGWRRYNIPKVIKGAYELPKIIFEKSKGISGTVTSLFLKRPVKGSNVTFVSNDGSYGILETDEAGRFEMVGLDYPDSVRIILQAKNINEKDNVYLDVEKEKFPKPVYASNSPVLTIQESLLRAKPNYREDDFLQKAAQRAKYDEEMRLIQLDEVTVAANKPEADPVLDYYLNVKPDFSIHREAIEQYDQKNVDRLMASLPGVAGYFESGVLVLRVSGSQYSPVVIIDGVQQNWFGGISPFNSIKSVDDIKEVFVVGGGKTARFGTGPKSRFQQSLLSRYSRINNNSLPEWGITGPSVIGGLDYWGDNGAIIVNTFEGNSGVYTRRRHFNNVSLRPIGYQSPAEFYSPRYETPDAKQFSVPDYRTTIFWKPDIAVPKDGKAYFDFYTSDFPTTYSVVIEGISTDGKIVRQVEKIMVSE